MDLETALSTGYKAASSPPTFLTNRLRSRLITSIKSADFSLLRTDETLQSPHTFFPWTAISLPPVTKVNFVTLLSQHFHLGEEKVVGSMAQD